MEIFEMVRTAIVVAVILGTGCFMRALYAHMVLQDDNAECRALIYLQCCLAAVGVLLGLKFMVVFCLGVAGVTHIVARPFDPVPVEAEVEEKK